MTNVANVTLERGTITTGMIDAIRLRLIENKAVRRTLPGGTRVHLDSLLPFLVLFRGNPAHKHRATKRFVASQSSFITTDGTEVHHSDIAALMQNLAHLAVGRFGSFLVIELWEKPLIEEDALKKPEDMRLRRPSFRIHTSRQTRLRSTIEMLESTLENIRNEAGHAKVAIHHTSRIAPQHLLPVFPERGRPRTTVDIIGIEIDPVYYSDDYLSDYPQVARMLRKQLAQALRQTVFVYLKHNTTIDVPHFHTLGRRALVKAVWESDQRLSEINAEYNFLLGVTPVHPEKAWHAFQRKKYSILPVFKYRPLPMDPALLKRKLYTIPLERIEDPAIDELLREKRDEIDRELTMLQDRGTKRFLYGSMQVHGTVSDVDYRQAKAILVKSEHHRSRGAKGRRMSAKDFASLAEQELELFRQTTEHSSRVLVRDDVSGILVSSGNLLISTDFTIRTSRASALLQHEAGTHILTYINGSHQPLQLLRHGLVGYEELQEGLAVLAEYFAGGLDTDRLRLLAARVVAVRSVQDGADFIDTFRLLTGTYGWNKRAAFNITMRVHRSGGLTKDACYLRGVISVMRQLQNSVNLQSLLIGKFGTRQLHLVQELLRRGILKYPKLLPSYMKDSTFNNRLQQLRSAKDIFQLM